MLVEPDFYRDRKFCPSCERYVRYLRSPAFSYCAECGGVVRLFSEEDRRSFARSLARTHGFDGEAAVGT